MLPIIYRGHDDPGFFAHAVGMGVTSSPLRVLPDNQRTAEARYACLIVVKDFVRLRLRSRSASSWHYTDIEPAILADVRAGRAVLVFDLSNEGPAYDPDIFGEMYAWIEGNRLPAGRCIWLGQNRRMASAAAFAGSRAALVHFGLYDYFVKLMAWKFSLVATGEVIGPNPQAYLELLRRVARKDKILLCLNATPRLARTLTVAALHHHELAHRSLISFPGMDYVKTGASLDEITAFLDQNASLTYLRPSVQTVSRIAGLRVDQFQERGNDLVEKIDRSAYERTFFSLITESDFTEQEIVRVTEKTVKAFCMGHPALIIGNPHSIGVMQDFGFQDWGSIFDRTADSIEAPAARFEQVFKEVLRQAGTIRTDPYAWLAAGREISIYNHRYAISGEFLAHYTRSFDKPLLERMQRLVSPS